VDTASLLAPLAEAPERAALLFDVDGTLAPIVARPELAAVPEETRTQLRRLAGRYRLVACLSGRPGEEAARLVSVDGVRYVGNHGLELDPRADELAREIARFRAEIDGDLLVEDKRLTLSFHFREAADESTAVAALEPIARAARERGLDARWGRKVLEIRPRVDADKGTAVVALLAGSGADRALYAGDDTTDIDAFRGLDDAGLARSVRIAVSSPEAPPALIAAADLVVAGPPELLRLLETL
jgi:trehalose 6-phosphate phosphatase